MTTIGLIAGSYKPYHAGHAGIIQKAAEECDEVHLYVSISDRVRPGEVPIRGADMAALWKQTIEKSLPSNVKVTYGGSPIGNIWKELGEANEARSHNDYVIYSDPIDIANNFRDDLLMKYCGYLYASGHVRLRPVDRTSTVNISGTRMREFLAKGDKENFMKFLPDGVDKELFWTTLWRSAHASPSKKPKASAKKPVKSEGLLKTLFGR